MNPKTLGIFASAVALSAAAFFLVIKGGAPPVPPTTPPTNIPTPPPPTAPLQPQASVRFGHTVVAHAQISQSHLLSQSQANVFLNVELEATTSSGGRSPVAAALVIDRSGSMAGVKIDNARDAALAFLKHLRNDDRLAVISYGSDVSTNLRLSRVGDIRGMAQRRIVSIDAGGGTNIAAGLRAAIRELQGASGARRVLLISDGRPTEGPRSPHQLAAIAELGRRSGIAFSSMGVGLDYDENVMERIALHGGGGFYHLRRANALAGILRQEFESMETLVASAVQLRIAPSPGVEIQEVYGYALRNEGSVRIIDVGDLASGEKRRLVARVRVHAGAPALHNFASLGLSYQRPDPGRGENASAVLSFVSTPNATLAQNSQDAQVTVAAYKVEAAAAVRSSMEAMGKRDRALAVETLRKAQKRIRRAAARAPAAAAPMLQEQAAAFDAMEIKTRGLHVDSEADQDYIKSQRASSFAAQRAY